MPTTLTSCTVATVAAASSGFTLLSQWGVRLALHSCGLSCCSSAGPIHPPPRSGRISRLSEASSYRIAMPIKTKPKLTAGAAKGHRRSLEEEVGAGGGNRTHTPVKVADFKSAASTVPPPRHYQSCPVRAGTRRRPIWILGTTLEATGGFEPPHRGFADLRLNHLATSP